MKRLASSLCLSALFVACGSGRPLTDPAAEGISGPSETQSSALELSVSEGNYYVCLRRDTSYRDGGATLVLANRDTVPHSVELAGVTLQTVDGVLVAHRSAFGLFNGRLPNPLAPGSERRDWIGFEATDAVNDDIDGEQLVIEVEFLVDGEPVVSRSEPFEAQVNALPDQTSLCPV